MKGQWIAILIPVFLLGTAGYLYNRHSRLSASAKDLRDAVADEEARSAVDRLPVFPGAKQITVPEAAGERFNSPALKVAQQAKSAVPVLTGNLEAALRDYPEYRAVWEDKLFRSQFDQYMRWLASPGIKADDAVYLMGLVDQGVGSMDLQAGIFHEMMEFKNWMRLGHRFEDIMQLEYYQQHYDEVYPKAHCNANIAQQRVINSFARRQGLPISPMLAYVLVAPDYELRQKLQDALPTPMLARQLKYNQDYFTEPVRAADLNNAVKVFKAGGYTYKKATRLIEEASVFLRLSENDRLAALKLSGVSQCEPVYGKVP